MFSSSDNALPKLKLEVKGITTELSLDQNSDSLRPNPIRETFRDVSVKKLLLSTWRVFWRIEKVQGWRCALRVFPIVWMIIKAVRGFSQFHSQEFDRIASNRTAGKDLEEAVLTNAQNDEYRQLGRWLCQKLHDLGPTFIKIGQTLSTRADLLPLPAMLELAVLQESVQPFPEEVASRLITRELGDDASALYASFNWKPIAAASLCQAYLAKLKDGRDVVVKVQRPNLPQVIAGDVQVLSAVADEVMQYPSLCRHTDWPGVVDEFARTIFEEIDYIREGRNADKFRHNFKNFDQVRIPRIIWRLTGRRVLTIEYIEGERVTNVDALRARGVDPNEITKIGANFYLRQLLEHGFFHADPHPGNMRIMADGKIGIFDFGMVGRLSPELKQHLVNAFIHVIRNDYRSLIDDFVGMGFLSPDVDRSALHADLQPIIDMRFAEGMTKVRFRKMLFDFSDVCWRYPFRLPSEFTYVMRALLTLEGVALQINPDFNFIDAAMPFAQRLLVKNNGVIGSAILREVFTDGRFNPHAAISLFKAAAKLSRTVSS
jgi:predicted unusual protein kinase regulating ubiquinone biosynthesis (AarF/ABC1/UbiB family)